MTEQRFTGWIRSERRRRIRRLLTVIGLVAVASATIWAVWFSQLLTVRHVEVEGQRTLKASYIKRIADVPMGEQLARLNTTPIQVRLAKIDRMQSVEVKRSWPRTVTIEVTERTPVAWMRSGGEVRAVDGFGLDYRALKKEPTHLPEIRIGAFDSRQRQQAMEATAQVLVDLSKTGTDILKAVDYVSADTKDSVTLELKKSRSVMWGSVAHPKQKVEVLRALLKIKAARYDVSAPEQPTTRQ